MTNRYYTFWGRTVTGETVKYEIIAASMSHAVAVFQTQPARPETMGWFVRVGRIGSGAMGRNSYPVTRERWGRAFDGELPQNGQ